MGKIESAVAWAEGIANDSGCGYSQAPYRWGEDGSYDCSSLVISAWEQAGVPVKSVYGATYTGNMRSAFRSAGFIEVADGTKRMGDVLLNETSHTAMMISETYLVQASCNENGGVTGGTPGDQGNEINIHAYYDFPWDVVLRYAGDEAVANSATTDNCEVTGNNYTVKTGDTLWSIAVNHGLTLQQLLEMNPGTGIATYIYPGQTLVVNSDGVDSVSSVSVSDNTGVVGGQYTVKSGDTLWGLSQTYGTTVAAIMAANPGITDANKIWVGQSIVLPGKE